MPNPSTALFVSPHLDDVAFSCAGTMATLQRRGWRIVLATVFTRSHRDPTGFALACQLDKHLPPDVDYLALRRDEDARFGRTLAVDRLDWLDLPEAPHRGYESAPALFAGVRPDDAIDREIGARLGRLVAETDPARIFAPQGVGNHADHLQVIRAVRAQAVGAARTAWYRDLPYAARFPEARPSADLDRLGMVEVAAPLTRGDLASKVAGSLCYTTQVPFQFGTPENVATVLGDFARSEGQRLGVAGPVETFLIDPRHRDEWAELCSSPS